MIVKFFPHKKGNNPKASIDYLLKKQEGLVRTLSGDPRLSQKIAEGLSFKNKYTVGCLFLLRKLIFLKIKSLK